MHRTSGVAVPWFKRTKRQAGRPDVLSYQFLSVLIRPYQSSISGETRPDKQARPKMPRHPGRIEFIVSKLKSHNDDRDGGKTISIPEHRGNSIANAMARLRNQDRPARLVG